MQRFPRLDNRALPETGDALHAYARVLGAWMTSCRAPRKHWWQGSLRPALNGLTTGVIQAGVEDFELALDLQRNELLARTAGGEALVEPLGGQSAGRLVARLAEFLVQRGGLDGQFVPTGEPVAAETAPGAGYSAACAQAIARAWGDVAAAMIALRAGIREETSPIQLWPHHFDLSMVWLPGETIPGQDPEDPVLRRGGAPSPTRPLRGDPESPSPRPRGAYCRAPGAGPRPMFG
jgi:hypothetical protein